MRKEGTIKNFNMYTGAILSEGKKYIFKKRNNDNFQEGDIVTFEPLQYNSPDLHQDVAVLVKKIDHKKERNR